MIKSENTCSDLREPRFPSSVGRVPEKHPLIDLRNAKKKERFYPPGNIERRGRKKNGTVWSRTKAGRFRWAYFQKMSLSSST